MASDIYVISDLHMGDGGPRDQFSLGGRALALERFVQHVGRAGGELFILGDLFEFWQMNLSRLLRCNRRVIDRFAEVGAIFVPGNHDVDLAHFVGTDDLTHPFFRRMSEPFSRSLGGRTFRFFHGHEVDPFNRGDDPGWGRMLTIFAGIFEQENGSPLLKGGESVEGVLLQFGDSMLDLWSALSALIRNRLIRRGANPDMRHSLTPAQNPDRVGEHVQQVRQYIEASAYDVAVLGHTHKPGHIGEWYFNSGTWVEKENPFLRIRPSGEVGYFLWTGEEPIERPMPVAWAPPAEARLKLPKPVAAARQTLSKLFPHLRLERPPPAKRWLIAQGALSIGAGAAAFILWGRGLEALIALFAGYTLLSAVLEILAAQQERSLLMRLFDYVQAGVSLLFALVAFLRPSFSMALFFFLVGAWALGVGCLKVAAATLMAPTHARPWEIVGGLATAVVGFVLMAFSGRNLVQLALMLWAWTVFSGATQIIAGIWGHGAIRKRIPLPRWRLSQARAS